jgi:hypothetical protein
VRQRRRAAFQTLFFAGSILLKSMLHHRSKLANLSFGDR